MLFLTRIIPVIGQFLYLMFPVLELLKVNTVISAMGLCYEGISVYRKGGPRQHYQSPLNVIDTLGFLAGIVWNVSMISQQFQCTLTAIQDPESQEQEAEKIYLKCD